MYSVMTVWYVLIVILALDELTRRIHGIVVGATVPATVSADIAVVFVCVLAIVAIQAVTKLKFPKPGRMSLIKLK